VVPDEINSKGQIIGYYFDSSATPQHGFLDTNGTYGALHSMNHLAAAAGT
jgi:hypothetical protein